jgi:excisionase family DNA binding protein
LTDQEGQWLNTREAIKRLGVPARQLYRLIDEGTLPAYRAGRDLRLLASDVDQLAPGRREEG